MRYLSLLSLFFLAIFACDDDVKPSSSPLESDQGLPTSEDQEIPLEEADQAITDMANILDEGTLDMSIEDMMMDQTILDQELVVDMDIQDPDMDLMDMDTQDPDMALMDMDTQDPDMDMPAPGLQIRESCERSDECAEGLSCLGWPTGSFCTPMCGYNPAASGLPSDPDCPPGYALECHVSNQCLPAQCTNGCDPGYSCDESNRCAPYE